MSSTPYTTVQGCILGVMALHSITVKVAVDTSRAEPTVTELLTRRHGSKDSLIVNSDDICETINSTIRTMQVLIAVISLVAGASA